MSDDFEIFLVCAPGTEALVAAEATAQGFAGAQPGPGGVTLRGGWPEVWRANLTLRGPARVLVRIAAFRALHLAQLDKRARKVPWADFLRPDIPVKIEAVCHKSRIYHNKAARQRLETAIRETLGAPVSDDAALVLKVRIDDDLCTVSLDSSGEPLHRRGHKPAVGKAPMRESLAALFLWQLGYDGSQTVLDPMCGSGTFPIEAAEIAAGLLPGRSRAFAFQQLASYDPTAFDAMKVQTPAQPTAQIAPRFLGFDRDQGVIGMARQNAERAGVAEFCAFERRPVGELSRPDGPPGLVIVNPPWGARIGERKLLFALYGALGQRLADGFRGWSVGIISPDAGLVKACALPLSAAGPAVDMGGTKVTLYRGTL